MLADSGEARRFVLFLLVGGLNTAVGFGLFALLTVLGLGPTPSLAVATVGGVLFNFQSIGRIVFSQGRRDRLLPFSIVYLVQFCVNLAVLKGLLAAGAGPLLAQALLLPFMAIGSFLAMRRWVFGDRAV